MTAALALALCTFLAHQHPAWAQDDDGTATLLEEEVVEDDDDDDDTVTLESDDAPLGASENPNSSSEFGALGQPEPDKKGDGDKKQEPDGYPLELTQRPLTLPRNTFEARIDLHAMVEHLQLQSQLKVGYGITDQVQIGLGYGGGTLSNHDVYDPFIVGKTVEVEGRYRLTSWAAAQIAVPVYVDPVAVGLRLGVPLKFRVFGKLALLFGEDFVTIKIYDFFPRLSDAIYNQDRVGDINTNTVTSNGELRFVGAVQYQYSAKTTLVAEFGFVAANFSTEDPIVPLRVLINHSPNPNIDVGVRAGFNNLDRAVDELGVLFTVALRI